MVDVCAPAERGLLLKKPGRSRPFPSLSGDLNPRPANYESAALPTELKRRFSIQRRQNMLLQPGEQGCKDIKFADYLHKNYVQQHPPIRFFILPAGKSGFIDGGGGDGQRPQPDAKDACCKEPCDVHPDGQRKSCNQYGCTCYQPRQVKQGNNPEDRAGNAQCKRF